MRHSLFLPRRSARPSHSAAELGEPLPKRRAPLLHCLSLLARQYLVWEGSCLV